MNHFLGGVIWDQEKFPPIWREYCERPSLKKMVNLPSSRLKFFIDWEVSSPPINDLQIVDREEIALIISGYPRLRTDYPDYRSPIDYLQQQFHNDPNPETVLRHIDGEFVIIGIHKLMGTIFLAIDPVGNRNLFYRRVVGGIIWGTNPLAISKDNLNLSMEGLNLYLSLKGIPAPFSIIENVHKISPGSFIHANMMGIQEKFYWHLEEKIQEHCPETYAEVQDELLQELKLSIKGCLKEVQGNIGTFLSGGLDSSIIVSLAKLSGISLQAYSVGYTGATYTDETEVAADIAGKFGIPFSRYKCSPSEILELIQQKLNDEIEPVADAAFFPEYLLSRLTSSNMVVLDGTGADCIFGGSNKYIASYYMDKYEKIPPLLRKHLIFPLSRLLPSSRSFRVTNNLRKLQYFIGSDQLSKDEREYYWYYFLTPPQLKSLLLNSWQLERKDWIDTYLKQFMPILAAGNISSQSYTTLKTIMPAVELFKLSNLENFTGISIRKPFLSAPIVEMGLRLPDIYKVQDGIRKQILIDIGKRILPEEILRHPKTNFNPPINTWINGRLRELFIDTVSSKTGIFDVSVVKKLEVENRLNWRDSSSQLWAIFVLIYWLTSNNVIIPEIDPIHI